MSVPFASPIGLARREAALQFLHERVNYERWVCGPSHVREFKLDRMRELLDRLGNPHQGLAIVHVAGTKGKGSTAAMIGAISTAAGYKTGLFTSPHLDRVEERLAINGQPCTSEEFADLVERMMPIVQAMDRAAGARVPAEIGPTYFEITTAMALLHFVQQHVALAVLEVGLGGRLDSTNVCQPRVSVITSISFDHVKQLGNTLEAIAREKAGIIKPGVPVVSGVVDSEPQKVIRQACWERGCRLIELGHDFEFTYQAPRECESPSLLGSMSFTWKAPGREWTSQDLPLRLLGRHQAANAAVAMAVLTELAQNGWTISDQALRTGLGTVNWPARVEVISRRPVVVVDAAHNLASIDALVRALDESFSARRRLLVFATTQEKDLRGMLTRLAGHFDHVILTRYTNNPRGVPAEELASLAWELTGQRYQVCHDPAAAWDEIRRLATPEDLIVVTGSFFIATEMRREIQARPIGEPWSPRDTGLPTPPFQSTL